MNKFQQAVLLPAVLLLLCLNIYAQSANPTATLSGVINDQTGAVIPGAQIVIRNADTGQTRTVVTTTTGEYRVLSLLPGEYEIEIKATGFAPFKKEEFALLVGQNARFDVTLAAAGTNAEVNVSAEAPAVDIAQTAPSISIDQERIEELPVVQRRFLSFVLTAPGIVATGNQLRGGGGSAGAVGARRLPDSGFSFGGLRSRSNNIAIDGVDNNDETTGAGRAELSIEAIREFQIVNSGVSAEYGGASGGSVNAVTRSGSNAFHGGVFVYSGVNAMNARQPTFASAEAGERKPRLQRWQPGFDVGGPIKKDRTFFHATLEQEHEKSEDASDINSLTVTRLNTAFAAGTLPRLGVRKLRSDLFATAGDDTEGAFKINQQIGTASSLMVRYSFTNDRRWRDALGAGSLTDFSGRGDAFTRDHALVGQLLSPLNPNVVNDLRFQIARRYVLTRPNEQNGPQIVVPGVMTFGHVTDAPSARTEDHYQLLDSVAINRGKHLLRFGGAINHVRLDATLPDRLNGFAVFNSVDDLLAGKAELFAQAFGDPRTQMNVTSYGAFVQDHWQARQGLTIDFGARYDYETLPASIRRDANNVSPRIGVAYSPDRAHRFVLRASYGVFFDRYLLAFLNPALQKDGVRGFDQIVQGAAAANAFRSAQGGGLLVSLANVRPSIYRTEPNLRTPYSQQASAGFERQLFSDITLSVNYLFVKATHLSRTRNVNLTPPVTLTASNAAALGFDNPTLQQLGRMVFSPNRLDARYDAIYQLENSAASHYHGLTVALGRKLTQRFGLLASYTLSKVIDDASDFDEQPQNPYDLRAERALSRQDQRQRFVLSGIFNVFSDEEPPQPGDSVWKILKDGLELGPIITLGSGRPFNPLIGTDANRSLSLPFAARPLGLARNSLSGPSQRNVDLRVLERVWFADHKRLFDIALDFFNLSNHTNVRELNPFYGSGVNSFATFGRPIDAFNSRRVQLSVEFEF